MKKEKKIPTIKDHRVKNVEATLHKDPPQPERKADAIRNILFELHVAQLRKHNSNPCTSFGSIAAKEFAKTYEDIVDSSDIQSVSAHDKWHTALSSEAVSNLDCVKQLLLRCQAETTLQTPSSMSESLWPSVAAVPVAAGSGVSSSAVSLGHKPLFKITATSSSREAPATKDLISFQDGGTGEFQPTFNHSIAPFNAAGKFYRLPLEGRNEPELKESISEAGASRPVSAFKTAKEQLMINQTKRYDNGAAQMSSNYTYGSSKKSLGTRRGLNSRFVPPVLNRDDNSSDVACTTGASHRTRPTCEAVAKSDEPVDERLKGFEPKIVELITNEIMEHRPQMDWDDIAGLQFAKKTIQEIIIWPMLRPDIFTGLRGPPKGLLLFGPPGTGKTLIGKCIASQSKSTFFCISASSLTSKWVGEGEKMVRALFTIARCHQPAVIFIDEVDSLLSQRSDGEHESSRRIKTEFLVQLDGATTDSEDRILVIGATNRPQEIDEAARRRFVKRLYISLPERVAREHIIRHLMSQQQCQLTDHDIVAVSTKTEGYSGADMANLCREAALGPIRSIPIEQIEYIRPEQVPPITFKDFEAALPQVRPSVSDKDLDVYITWNNTYGSFGC